MADITALATRYLDAWNENDPAARRALVDEVFAADARYTDPLADVRGRDAIDALLGEAQQQFPGLRFSLGGPVDDHHHLARFHWHLGPDGTDPIVVGFDVVALDEEGRIAQVAGFLDKVPA
ncbi:nuclear transport factor 2 family protein [Actinocatenispora sera]|jgi:hypothetical protein|uniref:Isomerase n=1 Tax=Actinocatenispora sera TaxID=390989 RepID=A0A810KWB8_9ACTN|nr:nuclear transport factor 2 family protein [Actinocatenispora sera]BCJ26752.1 isomerase [Actinocatenispora sera]